MIPLRVAERMATTRIAMGPNGCHVSTYSVGSHGYAQIGWHDIDRRGTTTCGRAAWVYHTGEQIPEGMTVDHLCKNKRCVRFDHLRLLSNHENARRTFGRDWPLGQCAQGHSNSELVLWAGRLRCRVCARERQRRRRAQGKK